jgi:hypothetical protein
MTKNIENLFSDVNIDHIGPEGKFIHFIHYKSPNPDCEDIIRQKEDVVYFSSDSLICDKITAKMRLEAFAKLIKYLKIALEDDTDKEVEKTMRTIKRDIYSKLKENYKIRELELKFNQNKALYEDIKQEIANG